MPASRLKDSAANAAHRAAAAAAMKTDPVLPTDAGGPDRRRIERRGQRIRRDLAADNAEARGEDRHGDEDDGMAELADGADREHGDEIHQRQRAKREAVDDA